MNRTRQPISLLAGFAILIGGWYLAWPCWALQIPSDTGPTTLPANTVGSANGISFSFDGIASRPPSDKLFPAIESISLNLHECFQQAANYSLAARLIDDQRKTIACRAEGDACPGNNGLNHVLVARAAEQRNQSAADAGELFLRLVEVRLQKQLLDQAFEKIGELDQTLANAEEKGFATADAEAEVRAQEIELRKQQVELESAETRLQYQLNVVLGLTETGLHRIEPVFELAPVHVDLDVETEVAVALQGNAEVQALERANQNLHGTADGDDADRLLSLVDPRLGSGLAADVVRHPLLRPRRDCDRCAALRRQQLQNLKQARRDVIRQQVTEQVLKIHSSVQQMAVDGQELDLLNKRAAEIESSAELDASAAYIGEVANWAAQQRVRSRRISTAIEYEIAGVRLLLNQGRLAPAAPNQTPCTCHHCR